MIKNRLKCLSLYAKVNLTLTAIILVINLVAFSRSFCDAYTRYVYYHIANITGWLTDKLPFNLGEIMMYLAIAMVMIMLAVLLLFSVVWIVKWAASGRGRHRTADVSEVKSVFSVYRRCRHFALVYMKIIMMALVVTAFVYTFNWVIPFRGTGAQVLACADSRDNFNETSEYTTEDLFALRAILVDNLNSLAEQVDRDEDGYIKRDEDMYEEVVKAMQGISDIYPVLGGYYPKVKTAYCSDILDFMGIAGYTYPYTMEVTLNRYTTYMDYGPATAHEMAHHKGFYTERDANFISFLAGINSDSDLLAYGSYREILGYVTDECYAAAEEMYAKDPEGTLKFLDAQPQLSEQVRLDDLHNTEEYQENYEVNVNKTLEKNVSQAAENVADVGWDTQADLLEEKNYDGVVLMLLEYYFP